MVLRAPLTAEAQRRVESLLRAGNEVRLLVGTTDVTTVEAVARLRLLAVRLGRPLDVIGADAEVFDACGLAELL